VTRARVPVRKKIGLLPMLIKNVAAEIQPY
jgi:hypothetical protein